MMWTDRRSLILGFTLVSCVLSGKTLADVYNDTIRPGGLARAEVNYYARPGTTAGEFLRSRGYFAKEFYFKTKDGYILNIVRGTNPLINGGKSGLKHKDPILFVHGCISSASIWLINSKGARPQDWTSLNVSSLSLEELNHQIGHYDSARSMPLLAMNFGYEVWLLNRRGFTGSERRAGHLDRPLSEVMKCVPKALFASMFNATGGLDYLKEGERDAAYVKLKKIERTSDSEKRQNLIAQFWKDTLTSMNPFVDIPKALLSFGDIKRLFVHTFDPDYWNFSFDEQAEYDFPQAIHFVLKKTGKKKVIIFTHSAAGPLALMALTNYPKLSDKVSKLINWAPASNAGTEDDFFGKVALAYPFLKSYVGPIPFAYAAKPIQNTLQNVCNNNLRRRTLCSYILDIGFGPSDYQSPVTQNVLANAIQPTSINEVVQLTQMSHTRRPRKFYFKTKEQNIKRYGKPIPPVYDFRRIRLKEIAFYTGNTDLLASPEMSKVTASQLAFPAKVVIINETGVTFNHAAVFLHDQLTRLINLPSLKDIESEHVL